MTQEDLPREIIIHRGGFVTCSFSKLYLFYFELSNNKKRIEMVQQKIHIPSTQKKKST
jgi:hypothetical protein